ncbi:MAG: translation initiation factor IF-2 [Candidatus Cloacimonadota bacterium]|nr:MAG: translation initiation factor IF-2 [Candidatus Cloacimonadota bacterium]
MKKSQNKLKKKKNQNKPKKEFRMRVYELSKELNLSSNALIVLLKELGFDVKNHMSSLTELMVKKIKARLETDKKLLKIEEIERKKKIRRKKEGGPRKKIEEDLAKKRKRKKKKEIKRKKEEIEKKVKETVTKMVGVAKPKKIKKKIDRVIEEIEEEKNIIRISEFVSVTELADILDVDPTDIIKKCLDLGLLVTINQRLDLDTITMIADEYGVEVELLPEYGASIEPEEKEGKEKLEPRPPIVTVMGHVDHGKTLLLDKIRDTNVIAQEKGGITQHIGAYSVSYNDQLITFLDTPGHQAFTAMRARGAQITDIVVLVVAVDDGVMPQTIEAIDHARAANIPTIVALNKIDIESANPELVKQQLSKNKVLLEEYGGNSISILVSAKTGVGLKELLDAILLQSEMMELTARRNGPAKGVVIETRMDKGKGAIATVLIQKGTVRVGDPFVTGIYSGKVRAMIDEWNKKIETATPSKPVQIMGLDGLPDVGDSFVVFENEQKTKEVARKRQLAKREQIERGRFRYSLVQFQEGLKEGEVKELKIILKGDVAGSVEALADSFNDLSTDEAKIVIIHKGVAQINDSDVLLAAASNAIIVGFHVKANIQAGESAKREGVEIRLYNIIFEAISDIKLALSGLLEPEYEEQIIGIAEVKQVFRIPNIGVIAGSFIVKGKIVLGENIRVKSNEDVIFEGKVTSLKRFTEDVKEVEMGLECGIGIEGIKDIKENDIIEVYRIKEIKREL